jgi:hypothetical protein
LTSDKKYLVLRFLWYVGTGPANIFWEKTPCKKLADLHPGQGNLGTSKEQVFSGLQNLSSLHKIVWRSAEKISPFFIGKKHRN